MSVKATVLTSKWKKNTKVWVYARVFDNEELPIEERFTTLYKITPETKLTGIIKAKKSDYCIVTFEIDEEDEEVHFDFLNLMNDKEQTKEKNSIKKETPKQKIQTSNTTTTAGIFKKTKENMIITKNLEEQMVQYFKEGFDKFGFDTLAKHLKQPETWKTEVQALDDVSNLPNQLRILITDFYDERDQVLEKYKCYEEGRPVCHDGELERSCSCDASKILELSHYSPAIEPSLRLFLSKFLSCPDLSIETKFKEAMRVYDLLLTTKDPADTNCDCFGIDFVPEFTKKLKAELLNLLKNETLADKANEFRREIDSIGQCA